MAGTHISKEDIIHDQVIRAAQQLFQRYGLLKVTMEDVAKAVGKSKSSLYYYYKSKEEILDAVMELEISEIIAEITHAVNQETHFEQKIHAFCMTKLKSSQKRRALYNTMDIGMDADELSHYTKVKQLIHRRYMEQEAVLLRRMLGFGMEDGAVAAVNQKDLETLIFVLLSCMHGVKREMAVETDLTRLEASVDCLTHLILHGLER